MRHPVSLKSQSALFYTIVCIGLAAVLFTTPFLRYPFDMFYHLIVIDDFYTQLIHPVHKHIGIWTDGAYMVIPTQETEPITLSRPRFLWHYIWAYLFYLVHIDSAQLFFRAKIIHVVQTYISLFAIYYFSNVVIRNIVKPIAAIKLKWLSLWSTIIWLTVYATASQGHHQIWLMWYSLNYQITLPLFFYITALTLVLFLEETDIKTKVFFIAQILLLSRFMLQVHSMEFMYYLMHMAVFTLVFIDKIYILLKRYFYIVLPLIGAFIYMAKHYQPEKSEIFDYLSIDKLPALHEKIMQQGLYLVNGYNRAFASVNELIYVSLFAGTLLLLYFAWKTYSKKEGNINLRMYLYLYLTSLFVLIPLFQFSGGLFAIITKTMVVNRLYYSASLFVLLPLFFYIVSKQLKWDSLKLNLAIATSLIIVAVVSKHTDMLYHNYYKNLQSLKNSFDPHKTGFNLTEKQIKAIGTQLTHYENTHINIMGIRYYARPDIAFVLKYIYRRNVFWQRWKHYFDYQKEYEKAVKTGNVKAVLFKTPKRFPGYFPYR